MGSWQAHKAKHTVHQKCHDGRKGSSEENGQGTASRHRCPIRRCLLHSGRRGGLHRRGPVRLGAARAAPEQQREAPPLGTNRVGPTPSYLHCLQPSSPTPPPTPVHTTHSSYTPSPPLAGRPKKGSIARAISQILCKPLFGINSDFEIFPTFGRFGGLGWTRSGDGIQNTITNLKVLHSFYVLYFSY